MKYTNYRRGNNQYEVKHKFLKRGTKLTLALVGILLLRTSSLYWACTSLRELITYCFTDSS
jgi:membrane protein CcdC involved in cytochrome C biogenesis